MGRASWSLFKVRLRGRERKVCGGRIFGGLLTGFRNPPHLEITSSGRQPGPQRYGFLDALNPTLRDAAIPVRRGQIVAGIGWFNDDYLGIDQGPIIAMIANHRNGIVWEHMKENPYIVRGLCRAGFTGGWLEGRCE